MNKQLELQQQVDLFGDALLLLLYWANHDEMETTIDTYSDGFESDFDNFKRKSNIICEMYQYVKDNLKVKKEDLDYYFKIRGGEFFCYGALSLLWDSKACVNKAKSYEETFQNLTETEKVKRYASIINSEEALNMPDNLLSFSDFVTYVDSLTLDSDVKWEVIKIFNNQEKYYDEVCNIILQVTKLLKDKFNDQITELEKQFYDYWSKIESSFGIIELIEKRLSITWEYSKQRIKVVPLLFLPFSITIAVADDNKEEDIIRISVLLDERLVVEERKIKKEDIINIGKLLSDKSKIDLLEFVSKKPCYGKEIANELGLSTATISYHVNALLKIGFLKADINSNKVYYSINKKRIASYLDDVKRYFSEIK